MKRKNDDEDHGGMKLRSGKVIDHRKLPKKLENELESDLQNFKTAFSANLKHAKELLEVISEAQSIAARVPIRNKIDEAYDYNIRPGGTGDLEGAATKLACTLIFHPRYHDIIETRIKEYDLETPLAGNVEE